MVELEAVKPFQNLNRDELQHLRQIVRKLQFPAGTQIFGEGDPGDGVYIIKDGLVEIAHLAGISEHRVFSRLGPGEMFGEMAVIEDLPRSATAIAAQNTQVYFIPRDSVLALLKRSPELAFSLLRQVSRRLRNFNQLHLREIIEAERLAVVGNFARSILHDLKNPLSVISLAAETLDHPDIVPQKRAQSLGYIRKQTTHIKEMIGDILEFTENAGNPASRVPTDYHEFITELLTDLNADAETKSARVELENEPPAARLLVDNRRLRRVFFNLLHNAMYAMPGGKITLRFQQNEQEVVTEMEDTGPGIAPQVADRLFQPFATHGKPHGSGLGLSICKRIIEDHGGQIWARNKQGHGAIFSFTLPVCTT